MFACSRSVHSARKKKKKKQQQQFNYVMEFNYIDSLSAEQKEHYV